MTDDIIPDSGTPFGERVQRRLRDEKVIWLTTVDASGTPQPNPVWFLVDGASVLIYNRRDARRLAHIRRAPRVSLNLDGDGRGGDIIVMSGQAEILENEPLAHQVPSYMDKYASAAASIGGDVEAFSGAYPIAVRVTIDRVRGY